MKDKKPSSRNHLKLELLDVKKLANKLSETITDKDVAIEQLRIINKQLNAQITAMNGSS